MIEIKIDTRQLQRLAKDLPGRIQKTATSVLKTESNRLRGELESYAKSMPSMVSPLTQALRKYRQPIGPLLSRLMSYEVDERELTAKAGILERGRRPVNPRVAILAKRQAKGFKIPVTRKAQRTLGRKLAARYKALTERRQWGLVGGMRTFIPRIGTHTSKARPIADPVLARQRQQVIANVKRNFAIKFNGKRY